MNCRQIDKQINPVGNFRHQNFKVTFGKVIILNNYTNNYSGRSRVIRGWKEGGADWMEAGEAGRRQGGRI